MRELVLTIPDDQFDNLMEKINSIPGIKINTEEIPHWHKAVLDERFRALQNNPKMGKPYSELRKELLTNGRL